MTSSHVFVAATLAGASVVLAAQTPAPANDAHRRTYALGDYRLESGAVLPSATLAYATFGTLNAQRDNAILIPSWYGSDHHGYDFLIGAGRALDPAKYFLVATEMFANGFSSSPSNTPPPFKGPAFPAIAIRDNVEAARRLLTSQLGITHLRAVVGFSMGAQQAFQWAVSHPDFVTAIVPYCGTAKTYPHGVVRLEGAISALTADAAFEDGHYTSPPKKGLAAWSRHWAGWVWSQEWWRRELFKPQWSTVTRFSPPEPPATPYAMPTISSRKRAPGSATTSATRPDSTATTSGPSRRSRLASSTCRVKPISTFRSATRSTRASSSRPSR